MNITSNPFIARLLLLAAIPSVSIHAAPGIRVHYIDNSLEKNIPSAPVRTAEETASIGAPEAVITLAPGQTYQKVSGLGAAFSEIGTLAVMGLPEDKRRSLLYSLFEVSHGAGFSLCRLPIGSSDFATSAYSYAEKKDDYELAFFSIDRDRASLIPVVRAARETNPELAVFASPWSPPGWMKISGTMDKGGDDSRLRNDKPVYQAWADYLVKYLAAYRAEGIPISRVCPQNEMDCNPKYPGCVMTPDQTVPLVVDYLAPRLKASGLPVELWAGTFREGKKAPWATACMRDARFRESIIGLAIQYFEAPVVEELVNAHRGVRLMHSEANCNNGDNSAAQARARMGEIIGIFNAGCENYAYWNMILDENQKSGWDWKQNSLVTIDRATSTITWNPDFQPVCLVSRWVRPGDVRISASITGSFRTPLTAFRKPDGRVIVLAQNQGNSAVAITIDLAGNHISATLPASADCVLEISP